MGKAMILFFDSRNEARLMKRKVEDGCIEIEGKKFVVDVAHPLLLKTFGGYKPLYILKWNSVTPSENMNPVVFERENPKFKEGKFDITPEMLRKMMGLKILGNMIKMKKKTSGFIMLVIGLIVGVLMLFSLIYLRVIPI